MKKKIFLFGCAAGILLSLVGGCTTVRARDVQNPKPREIVLCEEWRSQAEAPQPQN